MKTMGEINNAAADFYRQSINNSTDTADIEGGRYLFDGGLVAYINKDKGDDHMYTMGEFVGGVAFSLVEKGELAPSEATPTDVANVCYVLGSLIDRFRSERKGLTLEGISRYTVGGRV